MRDFRFGFTLASHGSQRELVRTCATAEAYGFDIAVAVDHLGTGRAGPLPTAMAAALATERMRVGTYVLDIGFWNAWMLARDVVTVQRLSGGRFELGLGTGIVKAQFDAAGIPWQPYPERVERLRATIDELRQLMDAEADFSPPPLLVGGSAERTLRLAAERADIVSFGGRLQVPGQPPGTLRIISADEADERVALFTAAAGDRAGELERNAFVLDVEVTDDPRAAAERVAAEDPGHLSAEELMASPFVLLGTEEQIARKLLDSRERYGFSSFYVQRPHMPVLGPVIKQVRSLAGG